VVEKLITQGWPSEKTVFEHAAYELLKWHSNHRDDYVNSYSLVNPGAAGLNSSIRQREQSPHDYNAVNESYIDRDQLRQVSPSKRAANVLKQTASKYPELDQAAQMENYKREVSEMSVSQNIQPIQLKSRRSNGVNPGLRRDSTGQSTLYKPITMEIFSQRKSHEPVSNTDLKDRFGADQIRLGKTATKRATNLHALQDNEQLNKIF